MLDTKESPCEKSPDYNFAHCVENKLAAAVGCKPYWIDNISLNLPVCVNGSQYAREAFKSAQLDICLRSRPVDPDVVCPSVS